MVHKNSMISFSSINWKNKMKWVLSAYTDKKYAGQYITDHQVMDYLGATENQVKPSITMLRDENVLVECQLPHYDHVSGNMVRACRYNHDNIPKHIEEQITLW